MYSCRDNSLFPHALQRIESGLKSNTYGPMYYCTNTLSRKLQLPKRRPQENIIPAEDLSFLGLTYGSGTSLVRLKGTSGLCTAFRPRPRSLDVSMMACKGNQRTLKPYPQAGRGTLCHYMTQSHGNFSCVQGQRSDAGTLHCSQVVELLLWPCELNRRVGVPTTIQPDFKSANTVLSGSLSSQEMRYRGQSMA
jgi:hypothetical protein